MHSTCSIKYKRQQIYVCFVDYNNVFHKNILDKYYANINIILDKVRGIKNLQRLQKYD